MNTLKKYNIKFIIKNNYPVLMTIPKYRILSQYLMFWDNSDSIVNGLIPEINFGIKYGTEDRFCKYGEVEGLETKMKERWSKS